MPAIRRIVCLACILLSAAMAGASPPQPAAFVGDLTEIIPHAPGPGGLDVSLRFTAADGAAIQVDDIHVVSMLENTYSLLLSDHTGRDAADLAITVKFENLTLRDGAVPVLDTVETVYPRHPDPEPALRYRDFDPGRPAPDAHHRYIDVPVSYARPELGTFPLSYELSSDWDPARCTVLVPTDAQRSISQVGWADRYREIFDLDCNVVTYEFRGMPCSRIDTLETRPIDWVLACEVLGSDAVVEDIERIRRDLLGDRPIDILGGSGTAMIGLKYVARYPQHVRRAFLMSFFKDARGSSEAGTRFFTAFLAEHDLEAVFDRAMTNPRVDPDQLLFLVQRLLYFAPDAVVTLLRDVAGGDTASYDSRTDMLGTVDYFVRSNRKYRPWSVVFMWETNIPTALGGAPDINAPFLDIGAPIDAVADRPGFRGRRFDIDGLENADTEVLLVAGTLDPVAPVSELERIHRLLPRSRLAVFEANHCLQVDPDARRCRNALAGVFLAEGMDSPRFEEFMTTRGPAGKFLYFAE